MTKCHELKLPSKKEGKNYKTDCANRETIFRIIQSIPSPKAEPFKLWFARLAEERIQEVINPELAFDRARQTFLKKGYSIDWVNARIKEIPARNSQGMNELMTDAYDGGEIASITRKNIETKTGKPVLTSQNAIDLKKEKELIENK